MLRGEKETLGFYISGHPLSKHEQTLRDLASADIERLASHQNGAQVSVGGVVMELSVRMTKKGDRFALFQLEDRYGSVKVVAWPGVFTKANGVMANETPVMVAGRLEVDDGGAMAIIAEDIQPLDNLRERSAKLLVIRLSGDGIDSQKAERLHGLLDANRGGCGVVFEVEISEGTVVRVQPNQFVLVKVTPELVQSIKHAIGSCQVELRF
jgi:DNA polymerase-3 subunit alpha